MLTTDLAVAQEPIAAKDITDHQKLQSHSANDSRREPITSVHSLMSSLSGESILSTTGTHAIETGRQYPQAAIQLSGVAPLPLSLVLSDPNGDSHTIQEGPLLFNLNAENSAMALADGWQSFSEQQQALKSRLLLRTETIDGDVSPEQLEPDYSDPRATEERTRTPHSQETDIRSGDEGTNLGNRDALRSETLIDETLGQEALRDERRVAVSANDSVTVGLRPEENVEIDPELGILRLRPLSEDVLGTESSSAIIDPELGILRVRAISPPPKKQPFLFLQGNLSFFNGNNLLARTDPLPDTTIQSGLTLRAVPRIGPRTFLIGTASGNVLRYADHGEFDYDQLGFSVGVYHWLSQRAYLDVNWRNQQFFTQRDGDRFLNEHQIRASLGRSDVLRPDLKLNSAYTLQSSWSNPEARSRLTHRFNLGVSHALSEQTEASLSYQLALVDFTQQERYDSYHQLLAQLQFKLSEETRLTLFGGGRLGDSSHSLIDFDSTLLGLSLVLNLSLF